MFVSPGMVCRGNGGGTYAEIAIPMREKGVQAAISYNEQGSRVNIVLL